jgi:hypothetical protein
MSKQYLLREYYALCDGGICQDLLTEAEKVAAKSGTMFLTGILQEGDKKNGNGRIYPTEVLLREMKNYQKLINENRALGELDHPDSSVVELKNCSHMLTRYWTEQNRVMGVVKVLDTPSGKILKELVDGGVQIGISSRGLGSVKDVPNGIIEVQDDFQLICFDVVADPSTEGAFMNALKEHNTNVEQVFDKGYRINRILNDILG